MSTLSKGVKCGIISYSCNEVIVTPFVECICQSLHNYSLLPLNAFKQTTVVTLE